MKRKDIWKWLLQTFLPIFLFIGYTKSQTGPFSSEHIIAKYIILFGLYLVWHIYIELVRAEKL